MSQLVNQLKVLSLKLKEGGGGGGGWRGGLQSEKGSCVLRGFSGVIRKV